MKTNYIIRSKRIMCMYNDNNNKTLTRIQDMLRANFCWNTTLLTEVFILFFRLSKCLCSPWNKSAPLPSKSFPAHHLSVLTLDSARPSVQGWHIRYVYWAGGWGRQPVVTPTASFWVFPLLGRIHKKIVFRLPWEKLVSLRTCQGLWHRKLWSLEKQICFFWLP